MLVALGNEGSLLWVLVFPCLCWNLYTILLCFSSGQHSLLPSSSFFFFLTLLASKKIWCHPLCRAVSWYSLLPKYFSFLRLLLLLFSLVVEACKSLLCPQIIIICYCFLIFMLDQCIYVLCCLSQNIMHLWFFIIGNSSSCSAKWTPFPVKKENEICKIGKMFFVTKWKIIQLLEPSLYANFVGD
jgi:hypothetical protein